MTTVPGESYLLILRVPAADSSNFYRWSVDIEDPYPDGMVQAGTKFYRYQDAVARIIHSAP